MQRKFLLVLVIVFAIFLAGCNTVPTEEQVPREEFVAASVVYGKIKEVNGNEILLAVGSMSGNAMERENTMASATDIGRQGEAALAGVEREPPSFSGDERQSRRNGETPMPSSERVIMGEEEAYSPGNGERPMRIAEGAQPVNIGESMIYGEGEAPSFSGGERQTRENGGTVPSGGERQIRGEMQNGMAMQVSLQLTGEETIYQIPVTAKITAGNNQGAAELRFTQLAVKNVVSLHFNDNGDIIAVQLLQ